MRVILLTRDNRHYVLDSPAVISMGEVYGTLVTGGTVRVPVSNYAVQEVYGEHEIEFFRVRLRQVEEDSPAEPGQETMRP